MPVASKKEKLLLRQLNIAAVIIGIIKFSIGCESRVTKV